MTGQIPVLQRPLTASCPNELKRLAFYGAGPKMAGFNSKSSQNLQLRMAQHQQHQLQLLDENVNVKGKAGSTIDPVSLPTETYAISVLLNCFILTF